MARYKFLPGHLSGRDPFLAMHIENDKGINDLDDDDTDRLTLQEVDSLAHDLAEVPQERHGLCNLDWHAEQGDQ